jgi:hypothetical protein
VCLRLTRITNSNGTFSVADDTGLGEVAASREMAAFLYSLRMLLSTDVLRHCSDDAYPISGQTVKFGVIDRRRIVVIAVRLQSLGAVRTPR